MNTGIRQRLTLVSGLYFGLLFSPGNVTGEIYKARITIPKINSAPVIDGKAEDNAWQACTQLSDFVIWTLDDYTKDSVRVYLGYDDQYIYVAFINYDAQAGSLKTEVPDKRLHDTFLWGRNFDRISFSNHSGSMALMGDPKGTMADWKNGDMSWNGTWTFEATIGEESWTAEFRIPFTDFGLTGSPENEIWTLSLSRGFPKGESAEWDGQCSFKDNIKAAFRFGKWPDPAPGRNAISFEAKNTGKSPMEVICELELIPFHGKPRFINQTGQGANSDMELLLSGEPLRYNYHVSIPPGHLRKNLIYELPAEGSYYVTATCRDAAGKILLRNRGFWFILEPNAERLKEIRKKIGEGDAVLIGKTNRPASVLNMESETLLKELNSLEEELPEAWKNNTWEELSKQITFLEKKAGQFVHRVRYTALSDWRELPVFGVVTAHSILKLPQDKPFPANLTTLAEISAARNEYESFQLVILPFGDDLNDLEIEINDLISDAGNRISSDHIEISELGYNYIDWQAEYVAEKGWHPDPLLPYKSPVSVKGNVLCQPFWITIYIPSGTPPGDYRSEIRVTTSGGKEERVNVKLHVWDFELPVEGHLKTHSWDDPETIAGFYNLDELPLDWYLRFCDLLLKNRMNPGSAGTNYISQTPDESGNYDFSKVEKVLDFCLKRGLSRFSIIQLKKGPYDPEEAEKVYKFIAAYARFLSQKGWMDKALIELWDEPTSLEWKGVKSRAEKIRQIDPGLRLQLFAEGGPYSFWEDQSKKYGLQDLIDIWAPWRLIESPETQASGHEIWTYFCTLARGIAPNFYIDRPAIYQRLIAWYCWMYGVDGFEHWSTTYFWRNVLKGKPMSEKWPNIPWDSRTYHYYDGEGQLIYPGPDGWPLPSLRLEIFRDGMEDYEYLYLLNELVSKSSENANNPDIRTARQLLHTEDYMLKKYPMDVVETQENTIRFPDQPERILKTREEIARIIEGLRK